MKQLKLSNRGKKTLCWCIFFVILGSVFNILTWNCWLLSMDYVFGTIACYVLSYILIIITLLEKIKYNQRHKLNVGNLKVLVWCLLGSVIVVSVFIVLKGVK